jgi:hypothetical protein
MNKLTFDLVGMKYRNLPTGFLQNLVGSSISLATDPTNPVDEYAVRCYYIGRHFAYVERGKSKPVTELLKTFKPYSINILSTQNNSITVEISIDEWADLSSNEVGQKMKLLGIHTDDKHFIITTDRGERKVLLSWHGLPKIKAKCVELLGKNIKTSTWGDYDDSIWFSDLEEDLDTDPALLAESANDASKFPLGKLFTKSKSYKIYGPPGTGKTTTLISMVEHAINEGVAPESIAFISFSNEAANVAKQRVVQKFDNLGVGAFPHFSTMHSFATKLGGTLGHTLCQAEHMRAFDINVSCTTEWTTPGDPASVVFRYNHPVLDRYSLSIARQEKMDYTQPQRWRDRESSRNALQSYFQIAVPTSHDASETFWDENYTDYCQKYIDAFLAFKMEKKIITFDDVITKVASNQFPDGGIPTFDLLIIDEAQDLSRHLWKFAQRLINAADVSFIAGDDDQAIMVGIGASPETFVNFNASEPDHVLEQSWRVPKSVFNYVKKGVIPLLEEMPDRASKPWLARAHEGQTISEIRKTSEKQGQVLVHHLDFSFLDLINEVRLDFLASRGDDFGFKELAKTMGVPEESKKLGDKKEIPDWLIMSPTRASAEKVSIALTEYQIPHFFRNKPILNATPRDCKIRVQTIHISKGAEAENTAVVMLKFGDIVQLAEDPRLAYVALTRARERMFPRVIEQGLIGDMKNSQNFNSFAFKFDKMFPQKLSAT